MNCCGKGRSGRWDPRDQDLTPQLFYLQRDPNQTGQSDPSRYFRGITKYRPTDQGSLCNRSFQRALQPNFTNQERSLHNFHDARLLPHRPCA